MCVTPECSKQTSCDSCLTKFQDSIDDSVSTDDHKVHLQKSYGNKVGDAITSLISTRVVLG